MTSPEQRAILAASTHFSPVDLVCRIRDYRGQPFNLAQFVDLTTAFISKKTYAGRPLKALELPGLWNGAMAHWNTVFVEVPLETFNPVKTVFDLLRPVHQADHALAGEAQAVYHTAAFAPCDLSRVFAPPQSRS